MTTDIQIIGTAAVPQSGDGLRALVPAVRSNPLPARHAAPAPEPVTTPGELAKVIEEIAARAQQSGAELDFQIDDESGRVIVRILDRKDGTVLRQMPSEEALRIAKALAQFELHLIEARA